MKAIKILTGLSLNIVLLLHGGIFGLGIKQGTERSVVFDEVGQFNDGGMAVNVLVAGDLAFVCEFDNGLEILRFRGILSKLTPPFA